MISTKKILWAFDVLVMFVLVSFLLTTLGIRTNPFNYNEITGVAGAGFMLSFYNFVHRTHDREVLPTSS